MRRFFEEFKDFISRGNVVDLAIAVVIGAAFTAIINSVVADFIMPVISAFTGGIEFSQMKWVIPLGAGESAITYGNLIKTVIQFVVIAFIIFCTIKGMKSMKKLVGIANKNNPVEEVRCQYCMEVIHQEATRCPHCTAELSQSKTLRRKDSV